MFHERLNMLLISIGASGSDIAVQMECDRSNVNRFIKGQRTPKPGGSSAVKLIEAICSFADKHGKTDEMRSVIGCESSATAAQVRERLALWLFESTAWNNNVHPNGTAMYREFGQRLSILMKLTGLSNSRLSQLLSIDASYISRFRNGSRYPRSNTKIKSGICAALLERIYEQGKLSELAALTGISADTLSGRDSAYNELFRWLYGTDKEATFALEKLVNHIGNFSAEIKAPVMSVEEAIGSIDDPSAVYFGMDGLRKAVIRFFSDILTEHPREVFLYSDQNMDWMTSDSSYALRWTTLIAACIRSGTKINIIHNISRDLSEMADAIKSWLPLYPSGMIRSFYCKRRQDERFSTTLFLCPETACISGSNFKGTENEHGLYRYDTDPGLLNAHRQAYDDLLADSEELVKAYNTTDCEKLTIRSESEVIVFSGKLSLATMPESVLRSISDRHKIQNEGRALLFEMWKKQRDFYHKCIGKNGIQECIPVAAFSEYDKAPIADMPGFELSYTKEEYDEHLRNIISLSESFGYRFYPLTNPVFDKIRVRVSKEEVVVSRMTEPFITITLEHPSMCDAFVSYAEVILKEHYLDKSSTKALLEKCTE